MSGRAPYALRPAAGGLLLRYGFASYVGFLVALPLLGLAYFGLHDGFAAFAKVLAAPVTRSALWLSLWTATAVAILQAVLGTLTAWSLVRERFPGRLWLNTLVDLPLAIPTLVAGVTLAILYGPQAVLGRTLESWGFQVLFAPPAILLALLFVTLPFVVRAVEPVLLELDLAEEEAARTLGAGQWTIFWRIVLPALLPAILSGSVRTLARALGEFGSLVVVAGNIPHRTLTAPVLIFGDIESGSAQNAAALSLVLLVIALALHAAGRWLERRSGARRV